MENIIQSIGQTFSRMKRDFAKTSGTVFLLSTLFFVMFLLLMVVSFTMQTVQTAQNQIHLTFQLKDDIPDYKIALLKAQLLKMERDGEIQGFTYRDETQTLLQYSQSQPDRLNFIQENLGDDIPLSSSFTVVPSSYNIEILLQYFLQSDFAESIDTDKLEQSSSKIIQSKRTLEFLGFLKMGVLGILTLVLLGISIVTGSFIAASFHARKNEIFIMRLVGATGNFIRTPFIIESIILSLIALLVGWSIFFTIRYSTLTEMMSIFSSKTEAMEVARSINAMWAEFLQYLPIMFAVILLFTIISTLITLERLLNKRDILGGE